MTYNQIQYWNLQELIRSNKAREGENYRHNLAVETETHRSNVVYENETVRHNKQNEAIGWGNLSELSRHNRVLENETIRNNVFQNALGYAKTKEEQRHNRANEVFNYDRALLETEAKRQADERAYYHGLTSESYSNIAGTSFGINSYNSKGKAAPFGSKTFLTGILGGLTGIFMSSASGAVASGVANTNDLFTGKHYYQMKDLMLEDYRDSAGMVTTSDDFTEGMKFATSQFNNLNLYRRK